MNLISKLFLFFSFATLVATGCGVISTSTTGTNHQTTSARTEMLSQNQGNSIWRTSDFPIVVNIDGDITEEKYNGIVLALEEWNYNTNMEIFTWRKIDIENYIFYGMLTEPPVGEIFVLQTELGISETGLPLLGLTNRLSHPGTSRPEIIRSVVVYFDEDMRTGDFYVVALHEFGHALGLSHDRNVASIMYPFALDSFGIIQPQDMIYVRNQVGTTLYPTFLNDLP